MKNVWFYGIMSSLVACVIACGVTIYKSLDYPVEVDGKYFRSYQAVDKNFDKISESERNFNAKFSFTPNFTSDVKLPRGKRAHRVGLGQAASVSFLTNATLVEIKALLTRPHTTKFDTPLKAEVVKFGDSNLTNEVVVDVGQLDQKGRWQVILQLKNSDGEEAFKKAELWAE